MNSELQPPPVSRASYPPRSHNSVRVLIDGEETFRRIFAVVESARRSVWITVSFAQLDVVLPGRSESFLDVVSRVAAAGIDVRLLCWWSEYPGIGSFRGDDDEIATLRDRGCGAKIRWDAVPRGCHHQKSYVIDGEIAFVGGLNLTAEAMSSTDHERGGFHDLFAELAGPAVADVAHNFAQRWNQASITRARAHGFPSTDAGGDLDEGMAVPAAAGEAPLQLVRTVRRDLYRATCGWRAGERFELADGEESIRLAVLEAIESARERLYIENQFLMDPQTIDALAAASRRGVEVLCVVPLEPDPNLLLYPEEPMRATREALARLGATRNAALFGLVHEREPRRVIYVHAKLLIADDRVMQVGSANLWPPSYWRDSELNVHVWDPALAAETRRRLWSEHLLGAEASGLEDWLSLARRSQEARDAGRLPATRLVEIDPARYYVFADGMVAPWHSARESA